MRALNHDRLAHATNWLCSKDPVLREVVTRYGQPPLWSRRPGFTTLAHIVLEQQVTLASARAALERLRHAAGRVDAPSVARLTPAQFRAAGITRQKARYCHEIASRIVAGAFRFADVANADDQRARALLMELTGVGAWTADVYLLFALRRADIWPPGDLALNNEVKRLCGLPAQAGEAEVQHLASGWRPWRSVAARIVWHAYLSRRRRAAHQ